MKITQSLIAKNGNYYIVRDINSFKSGQVNVLSKFELHSKTSGFTLEDTKFGDGCFGTRISALGDVNGDGRNDFMVSSDWVDTRGAVYVIFGSSSFPDYFSMDDLNTVSSVKGFKISRASATNAAIGFDIFGNIDLNGDGLQDIVLGERFWASNNINYGSVSVIFGSKTPFPSILDLEDLNGSNGFTIYGTTPNILFGIFLANAGDLDGNGIDDLMIGSSSDMAFIVYGRTSFTKSLYMSDLDGLKGFTIKANMNVGKAFVSGFGDSNNDTINDFAISFPGATVGGNTNAGMVLIVTAGAISLSQNCPLPSQCTPKNTIYSPTLQGVYNYSNQNVYNKLFATTCEMNSSICENPDYSIYKKAYQTVCNLDSMGCENQNFKISTFDSKLVPEGFDVFNPSNSTVCSLINQTCSSNDSNNSYSQWEIYDASKYFVCNECKINKLFATTCEMNSSICENPDYSIYKKAYQTVCNLNSKNCENQNFKISTFDSKLVPEGFDVFNPSNSTVCSLINQTCYTNDSNDSYSQWKIYDTSKSFVCNNDSKIVLSQNDAKVFEGAGKTSDDDEKTKIIIVISVLWVIENIAFLLIIIFRYVRRKSKDENGVPAVRSETEIINDEKEKELENKRTSNNL